MTFNTFPKIIRLTPSGRGAVASILLYGSGALDILKRHWTGQELCVTDQPLFGRFRLEIIGQNEEVVVHVSNRNEIEIHSHGGEIVVSAIESTLIQDGANSVSWQDFFCNGKTQSESALRLLPFAPTEFTAQILLDQYNGALDREYAEIEKLENETLKQQRLNRLKENAKIGKHLVEPFRVVLAGASNAGKSSLFNSILGFQRSIVNVIAGTTRDVVSSQTALDGFPVTFYDTAGFRETQFDLERQGIERSRQSIANADLLVWVIDLTVPETEQPTIPDTENILICFNKIDLVSPNNSTPNDSIPCEQQTVSEKKFIVSATTGQGIETLLEQIIRRLVPNPPKPLEAVPL
ncbi:MAG: GTP-binding protein [Planctomycetaceae bacterium]|nr:GTP-binding protein [Planctomycetaceae bacterium]